MPNTTTTEVSHAINNFYNRNFLRRAYPLFVHTRWGQVSDIPTNGTNVIKWRRYTNLSAATTALTEGQTPTGSQLSKTDITATVAQYGDFVTLTDWLDLTSPDGEKLLTETSAILGDQAGDTLDQLCRDVIVAGTTIQYVQGVAARANIAAGMVLTGTEVKKMVRTLKGNNARKVTSQIDPSSGWNTSPVRACFVGICSEKTEYDLKNDPDWVPVEEYASSTGVMEGEIGKLDEVRFVSATSNAKTFSSTVTVHATLVVGSDAYGISRISGNAMRTITKPLGSSGTADPLEQRQTMGWKATFKAVILNDNFMGRIEHAVSS